MNRLFGWLLFDPMRAIAAFLLLLAAGFGVTSLVLRLQRDRARVERDQKAVKVADLTQQLEAFRRVGDLQVQAAKEAEQRRLEVQQRTEAVLAALARGPRPRNDEEARQWAIKAASQILEVRR